MITPLMPTAIMLRGLCLRIFPSNLDSPGTAHSSGSTTDHAVNAGDASFALSPFRNRA